VSISDVMEYNYEEVI